MHTKGIVQIKLLAQQILPPMMKLALLPLDDTQYPVQYDIAHYCHKNYNQCHSNNSIDTVILELFRCRIDFCCPPLMLLYPLQLLINAVREVGNRVRVVKV